VYQVEIGNKAKKRLSKLPAKHRRQALEHILTLKLSLRAANSVKLEVLDGYRIARGEYRVAYTA